MNSSHFIIRQNKILKLISIVLICLSVFLGLHLRNLKKNESKNNIQTKLAYQFLPAVDHLGIVVRDADKEADKLKNNLGAKVIHRERIKFKKSIYKGQTLSYSAYFVFVDMGNLKIEFVQPDMDVPSPYLDILNEKGEFAHHVCFLVPSLEDFLAKLRSKNIEPKIIVDAQADVDNGGQMIYAEGIIPGILVELAVPM